MENKSFNMRSTTAFLVTAAFLLSGLTGIVLFVVPEGRIANWVDWRLLGMLKADWANIHITFGLLFLIFGVIHLFPYNWATFKAYLAKRTKGRLDYRRPRKELLFASALSVALVAGAVTQVPPVSYLFDFNSWTKAAWVTHESYNPPFGHAEELSLTTFAKRMNMDLPAAIAEMKAKGITVEGPAQSLGEIAKVNGTSAMDLYMLIKSFEREREPLSAAAAYTVESIEELFEGKGVGKKTVAEVCAEIGFDAATAKSRLAAAGATDIEGKTLKEIADVLKVTPIDILKKFLLDPAAPGSAAVPGSANRTAA